MKHLLLAALVGTSLGMRCSLWEEEEEYIMDGAECTMNMAGVCNGNARCTIGNGLMLCKRCWRKSEGNPPAGWTQHGGDADCLCISRLKEHRADLTQKNTCQNSGGFWDGTKCYMLTKSNVNEQQCTDLGHSWVNGKCWVQNCAW